MSRRAWVIVAVSPALALVLGQLPTYAARLGGLDALGYAVLYLFWYVVAGTLLYLLFGLLIGWARGEAFRRP